MAWFRFGPLCRLLLCRFAASFCHVFASRSPRLAAVSFVLNVGSRLIGVGRSARADSFHRRLILVEQSKFGQRPRREFPGSYAPNPKAKRYYKISKRNHR